MKAPISWLRELVSLPENLTTAELAAAFTRAGLNVERIETIGGEVSGPVVVGRVLSLNPEPQKNGKTINWCRVDVGDEHNEPETTAEDGSTIPAGRGIVCGAHNFVVGDLVVVALPGAVLPGDFAIAARKTYGHVSDGMICAADELGVGEDHSGIIVLPTQIDGQPLAPGMAAMPLLGGGDEVLELDITPDIGYCLSLRGLAREAAQATGVAFTDPYGAPRPAEVADGQPVRIESPNCSSFVALTVTGVDPQAPSPDWMKQRLERSGMRSISLPVDVTNYVMLESGQPLHAYDADRLTGEIVVRQANPGEKLVTLDDATRTLVADDLLITDGSGPIGLAGVMGGQSTEVGEQTSNIVLEAAHFDPLAIGRTHRRHKLPSEASRRFERGVDPAVGYAAARRAAELLVEFGGGTLQDAQTVVGQVPAMPGQRIAADLPARILGTHVSPQQVTEILTASGVQVSAAGESLDLVPPTWRPDLADPYDYVEEVGRKIGLDTIQGIVPTAPIGRGLSPAQQGRRAVLRAIAQLGFVELISLPFVSEQEIARIAPEADDPRRDLVKLANPLDDTHGHLRSSLLPGLFQAVSRNTSRSQDDLALFEVGRVFLQGSPTPAPRPSVEDRPSDSDVAALQAALPQQPSMVGGAVTGNWLPAGWQGSAVKADWTHVVALAEAAAATLGVRITRRNAAVSPWHPGRCAELLVDGEVFGCAGELHPQVVKDFGLPERTCAVEFDLDALLAAAPGAGQISPLSSFPLAKEDVALVVDESVAAEELRLALVEGAGELLESCQLFDIYRGPQIGDGKKSLAYALHFRGADKTLKDTESAAARDAAVQLAGERFGAVQRA
ncbi:MULTISPECIES: phenylalanine--tRNA ligase subunit beta [unclassified Luteococcus]|uniref:phenylalanine--tRNA ligase subunit beta n=1 Tax=unclassified Luteococcus TaxID=2639923 RepID=UPI00313C57DD